MAWRKLSELRDEFRASGKKLVAPVNHRGCQGKIRYPTYEAAVKAMGELMEKARRQPGYKRKLHQLNVYLCQHGCGDYHCGHNKYADR